MTPKVKGPRKPEAVVLRAAESWWLGHRPIGWTETQHLANPTINAGYTARAKRLAKAVGRLRRSLKKGRR